MVKLFVFAGLPATGKTTLARQLAAHVHAVHLRIDTIEQALRDLLGREVEDEGYRLAYRIAADNLRLGLSVVADSCNPLEQTRREWEQVAASHRSNCVNIETICSDVQEHRRRIESRSTDIPGLRLPTWREVEARPYDDWSQDRLVIDTAGKSAADGFAALVEALAAASGASRESSGDGW